VRVNGGEGHDAEGIDVRGARGTELSTLKVSRGGEWRKRFPPDYGLTVWGAL